MTNGNLLSHMHGNAFYTMEWYQCMSHYTMITIVTLQNSTNGATMPPCYRY